MRITRKAREVVQGHTLSQDDSWLWIATPIVAWDIVP